jgi:hypothetical protein
MSAQTISWHYALNELYLCADCQRVSDSAITCPACGSQHGLLSMASALSRPDDSERVAGLSSAVDELEAAFALPDYREIEQIGKGRG